MKYLSLLLLSLAFLASCSEFPPIDPYLSFNIVRSVNFSIADTASTNKDTSIVVVGKIDTNDYKKNLSSAYLLRTSEVSRCYLHSNAPGFSLDQIVYARVLIGTDTVALDSIPPGATDPFFLTVTKADITKYMQDTSFTATLQFRFLSAPTKPMTITCGMTIVHTALPR